MCIIEVTATAQGVCSYTKVWIDKLYRSRNREIRNQDDEFRNLYEIIKAFLY